MALICGESCVVSMSLSGGFPGAPQREVYFMGLIDVLTQYDTKKKAAHAAKTVKHGVRDNAQIDIRVLDVIVSLNHHHQYYILNN